MSPKSWRERAHATNPELAKEIDVFEREIELKREGKLEDAVFGETRLRRGAYGQRYDNGQRHDGIDTRILEFPSGTITKGPSTLWDAPGMQRIKIPYGGITPDQLDRLAELAEEYSDAILHVTTRQDVQLHYIHIEDTIDLMYRLAEVGITTREACGNTVRNITACPYAGVCAGEAFDVTPHAHAMFEFLLGHTDAQDFGRKFKIAFSGCAEDACALANMHDLGFIAKLEGGVRGFEVWIGGGLGAVPQQAKLYDAFVPEHEILPLTQAVCRVFAAHGEKKNRARARLKFLLSKIGLEELRRLIVEARAALPPDPRWTAHLERLAPAAPPSSTPVVLLPSARPFERWRRTNARPQRQPGLSAVTVALPLGDLSSARARALSAIARRYSPEPLRTTVTQNIVLRFVEEAALEALFSELSTLGLAERAGGAQDITACPGTDTCKLGTSSSRGLAAELRGQLEHEALEGPAAELDLKISGCFNSCAQHHIADLGFYGVSRKKDGHVVPHFQVVLGGRTGGNAGAFGMPMGAVPSKRVPEVVRRISEAWARERAESEGMGAWIERVGKARLKGLFEDLAALPTYAEEPALYSDWGDPRRFTTGDMAKGECAGAVVPLAEFALAASEREAFDAQLAFEAKRFEDAAALAYKAMLSAARGLIQTRDRHIGEDPETIVATFRRDFYETELFFDRFAKGKFAHYLFRAHRATDRIDADRARERVEEAGLFIEAAHACYARLAEVA